MQKPKVPGILFLLVYSFPLDFHEKMTTLPIESAIPEDA